MSLARRQDRVTPSLAAAALACVAPADAYELQSVLRAQGPVARDIAVLSWVMFGSAAVILVVVMALTLYAVFAPSERWRRIEGERLVFWGGAVFPVLALSGLLVYAINVGTLPRVEPALRIAVTGKQFWWEVRYPDSDPARAIVSANEIHLPVGQLVEISVRTTDVLHSFWVPNFAGKIDMIPGRVNVLRLQADKPGVYRGQCAEYCGAQHARMAFHVVAQPPAEFEAWRLRERLPAREPADPSLRLGRAAFLTAGCGACHAIRGTEARGDVGPDLTHLGGRRFLAAGTLKNDVGGLIAWIADSQGLKPGNPMPSFQQLDGETLHALALYLASLR